MSDERKNKYLTRAEKQESSKASEGKSHQSKKRIRREYAADAGQGRQGGPGGGGTILFQKPKDMKGTTKRLVGMLTDKKGMFLLLFLICVAFAGVNVITPVMIGHIIDNYIVVADIPGLIKMCAILLGVYLLGVALQFAQTKIMVWLSQDVTSKMREKLYDHISRLPLKFYDTNSSGDVMSRLSNDVDTIGMTISQSVSQLISGIVTMVGIFIAMLILSPVMTLLAAVTIPLIFVITRSLSKVTRRYFRAQQKALGNVNGFIEEMISGQKEVKLFSREEELVHEFEEFNESLRVSGTKAQGISGIMGPVMNMMNNISYLMAAVAGGYLVVGGRISLGTVFSFLQYMRKIGQPLNQIATLFNTFQSALAASERVFAIMDEPEEQDAPGAWDIGEIDGGIEFKGVDFSYNGQTDVLKNAFIEAEPGQQIAIVGPTGAGKTTIISLLMRFYDKQRGEILVDGKPVESFTRESLRKNVGMVLQDTYLFSYSVKDNIRYGRPDATDEEVIAAAKMANAHSFIMHLPEGYDTIITENGSSLSQGQRQLLAIARAVLADPRMLILDEATSSIDTRTELMIQEAMLELMKGRTSFIIAHRLSTIRNADKILVIDGGEVVESGTHDELLDKEDGFYAYLYNSQYRTGMAI